MTAFDAPFDAVLHLLDRQVIDVDGLMVCKVDDLELGPTTDGGLAVTSLLSGTAALLPRLGSGLFTAWLRAGGEQADRDRPFRLHLELVDHLDSAIHLTVPRVGLLARAGPGVEDASHRRLSDLLRCQVELPGAGSLRVLDVRVTPRQGPPPTHDLALHSLIVGRGRPGSLLGYDRSADQGPWLVNKVVRRLHRHSALLPYEQIDDIDWDEHRIAAAGPLEPLSHVADAQA
jgi:hypothetical protein